MKVNIPDDYFQAFKWFEGVDPDARVAKLPMQTFWGWNFYSWGYQGAGLTWFGIPQPTLDREFDRWGAYNEDFYRQAASALYENDLGAFEETLAKYQVKYLLMDNSVINAGGSDKVLLKPAIKQLLTSSKHIKPVKEFGQLSIYESDLKDGKDSLYLPSKLIGVSASMVYTQSDPIFAKFGNYFEYPKGTVFPYANLDRRGPVNISLGEKSVVLTNRANNYQIEVPVNRVAVEDFNNKRGFNEATNCDLLKVGSVTKTYLSGRVSYRAENGGVSCDFLDYFNLTYSDGYLLQVKGENKEGRSLKIYLFNAETNRMDLEELLPKGKFNETYVIYPQKLAGSGYILNLETRSYGRIASENALESVEIYRLPINWITSLYFDIEKTTDIVNNLTIQESQKIGTALTRVTVSGKGMLVLGEGYEKGWIAISLEDGPLPHYRINSWANGWLINNPVRVIYIVFWPQLLEFLGGVIVLLTIIKVIKSKTRNS